MKIGIDIDGVIIDSERNFTANAILFSLEHFGEDRVIDKTIPHVEDRYDWPQEYKEKWFEERMTQLAAKSNFMPGAIEVINRLKNMGHELVIITARGGITLKMKEIALKQFEEAGLKFDEYYFIVKDKAEVCKQANVDVFIDDDYNHCIKAANAGIKTLYFRDINRKELKHENVTEVNNWGDIYKYIQKKTDY